MSSASARGMPCAAGPRLAARSRKRSVRAARALATLRRLHTQGLSRSPQTVPRNTEAADQTCWSAACAYVTRREKRPYLVAGVQDQHAPSGFRPDEAAGHGPALCGRPGGCTTQRRSRTRWVPRNRLPATPSASVPEESLELEDFAASNWSAAALLDVARLAREGGNNRGLTCATLAARELGWTGLRGRLSGVDR